MGIVLLLVVRLVVINSRTLSNADGRHCNLLRHHSIWIMMVLVVGLAPSHAPHGCRHRRSGRSSDSSSFTVSGNVAATDSLEGHDSNRCAVMRSLCHMRGH